MASTVKSVSDFLDICRLNKDMDVFSFYAMRDEKSKCFHFLFSASVLSAARLKDVYLRLTRRILSKAPASLPVISLMAADHYYSPPQLHTLIGIIWCC